MTAERSGITVGRYKSGLQRREKEFITMQTIQFVRYMNFFIAILFTVLYAYQFIYMYVALKNKNKQEDYTAKKLHRFAALICARNEEAVIGEIINTLVKQDYPKELYDIYVLADNCTDSTAQKARRAGAVVYERFNTESVGKGYALDYLIKKIASDNSDKVYDAYIVYDADNLIDPNFIKEMNKTLDKGFDASTSYRNSKNFASNWLSASYAIWFLREARFMNFPRCIMGMNCAVSGTGFMVSQKIVSENGGWPFHLLTEDIEFSANCVLNDVKIGYCDKAIVYDEQPTSFHQSYLQRLRWSKGFYQINGKYSIPLAKRAFKGGKKGFSCFDLFMTTAPGTLLSILGAMINITYAAACIGSPYYIANRVIGEVGHFVGMSIVNLYIGLVLTGLLTVVCEWKHIQAKPIDKLKYLPLFPLYMFSYIPIAVIALFQKVEWKQIKHTAVCEGNSVPEAVVLDSMPHNRRQVEKSAAKAEIVS